MKRGIKLLAAALSMVMLLSVTVFAASSRTGDQSPTITGQAANATVEFIGSGYQKLSVSYTAATANKQYLLLVVTANQKGEANTISQGNILYIDQAQADANGTVTFSTVYPSRITNSVVLLSGPGLESPMTLAKIEVPYTPGDVNNDGKVSAYDAYLVAMYVAGSIRQDALVIDAADVDGASGVTANDVTTILQYVVGIVDTLPQTSGN
jgi:hypothetical protein